MGWPPMAVLVFASLILILVSIVCDGVSAGEDSKVLPHPRIGERLGFHGRWLGIPVGYGWIEVKELVTIDGRQAIHIEAEGNTNEVLSVLYPVHDVVHSYLDPNTLRPLRFEKDQREGNYRAKELVTFDDERGVATYRSLLNNSVKEIELPAEFQDLISAFYWFRNLPIHAGQRIATDIYTDEKIYQTYVEVGQLGTLELLKRGTFSCFLIEPKASFKGFLVRRGRIWAYMTNDEDRLPLLVKVTTPWGPMSAVLDETSIKNSGVR